MDKKQRDDYIAAWQAENVERIVVKPNKKLNFTERIAAQVAAGKAKSRQDYIIRAVLNALEKDEE